MIDDAIEQTPTETELPRITPGSIVIALESFLLLGFASLILMRYVPVYLELFRHVKLPLPDATILLWECSDLLCRHPWVAGAVLLGAPFILLRLTDRQKTILTLLIPLGTLLFTGWVVYGLFFWCWMCRLSIGPARH